MTRTVAVIGGGITGLAAAHQLASGGVDTMLFEPGPLGGKLRSSPFAGIDAVDEGPDAFLARLPWATELATAVGLGDQLVSPNTGSAWVWWDRMEPIPAGLLLGLPTGWGSMATSRLLGWGGKLRAATEPLRGRSATDHDSLGRWVRARFGSQVHERLVDPLIGSIYAADTDRFSLAAVPQLASLAEGPRSVIVDARRTPRPAADGPVFFAPRRGMTSLVDAIAAAIADRVDVVGRAATTLAADGARWRVDDRAVDAVILACPAPAAGSLLAGATGRGDASDEVAAALGGLPAADVAIVTLALPAASWPERCHGRSGYLVPRSKQRLVTAVSFASQKWPHWASEDQVILRVSAGRDGMPVLHLDDDALVGTCIDDVSRHLGFAIAPHAVRITRWPRAFPQYRPHHASRVAELERALPAGIVLAGASYHGIGIPMCVRSGRQAALASVADGR